MENPDREQTTVEIPLRAIGRIRTPFTEQTGTPIQPSFSEGAEGKVILEEGYSSALDDIEGFERIWLLFWMDRASRFRPKVVPYRDTVERGLFSTRAPCRPNPVGLSAVRLLGREHNVLFVAEVDMLDGTPLLDIKPYVPDCDAHSSSRSGWLEGKEEGRTVADARFSGRAAGEGSS